MSAAVAASTYDEIEARLAGLAGLAGSDGRDGSVDSIDSVGRTEQPPAGSSACAEQRAPVARTGIGVGLVLAGMGVCGLFFASGSPHILITLVIWFLAGSAILGGLALATACHMRTQRLASLPVARVPALIAGERALDCGGEPRLVLRYLMLRTPNGNRREYCVSEEMADGLRVGDLGWASTREDELLAFDCVRS